MTTQAWQEGKCEATEEELSEAKKLSDGLTYKTTRSCCDGYEIWSSEVLDYTQVAELIRRVRGENQ